MDQQENLSGIKKILEPLHRVTGWMKLIGVVSIISGVLQVFSIGGLLIAWLPIWLGVVLLAAAKSLDQGYINDQEQDIATSMDKLRKYFQITGILNLIYLIVIPIIMISIIGILAAVAIPRFGGLVGKAREASTQSNLGALRSGIALSYGRNEGVFPPSLDVEGFVGTSPDAIMQEIPQVTLNTNIHNGGSNTNNVTIVDRIIPMDNGDWQYCYKTGEIIVDCTHKDTSGVAISTW